MAYGSNLHPLRLQKRIPTTRLIGVSPLDGFRLEFSKRSNDGSGKCTMAKVQKGVVFVAMYSMNQKELAILDWIEGVGYGYERENLQLRIEGAAISALTYIASTTHIDTGLKPYHWYRDFVIEGAAYLNFPSEYQQFLQGFDSIQDPDENRCTANETLLSEMKLI